MRTAVVLFGVVALVHATSALPAQSVRPQGSADSRRFAGTWTLDRSRSRLTGRQDRVEAVGPNSWKFTEGNFTATIPADGAFHPGSYGGQVAITVKSPREWQIDRKFAKLSLVEHWLLSADGKTMKRIETGKRADGSGYSDTVELKRVGGTSGFAGTWESIVVSVSIPELQLTEIANGVTIAFPADKMTSDCLFDGQPHAIVSPGTPKGFTFTCRKLPGGAISVDQAMDGKAISTSEWVLSPDGRTLTLNWTAAGQKKNEYVFIRR